MVDCGPADFADGNPVTFVVFPEPRNDGRCFGYVYAALCDIVVGKGDIKWTSSGGKIDR
jgi:hypothetical protein